MIADEYQDELLKQQSVKTESVSVHDCVSGPSVDCAVIRT
jgi:hypothetical protein